MKTSFTLLSASVLVATALVYGCSDSEGTTPNCAGWSDAATNDVCTSVYVPPPPDAATTDDSATDQDAASSDAVANDSSTADAPVD